MWVLKWRMRAYLQNYTCNFSLPAVASRSTLHGMAVTQPSQRFPTPAWPAAQYELETVVRRIEPLFDQLRGRTLFITGGTGFLGRWLVETILKADRDARLGLQLHLLTRHPERFAAAAPHLAADPALVLHRGDVRTFQEDIAADFIIHGAMDTSGYLHPDNAQDLVLTAVDGTRAILGLAARAKCRNFLLISSGAVYGEQPTDIERIPESFVGSVNPLNPSVAYAEGKRCAELLCASAARRGDVPATIARAFAFCGAWMPLNGPFALGQFIHDAWTARKIEIRGDGTPLRSYMHGADWAVGALNLLLRGRAGTAYNIGSDESASLRDVAALVASACDERLGGATEIHVHQAPKVGVLASRYVPDIRRAQSECGVTLQYDLRSSIFKTVHALATAVAK